MFDTSALAFHEFIMQEPLPLSTIQSAVFQFLKGREDVVLFGAQAVNAYVSEPRMTQDIDLLSPRAEELAEELRLYLNQRLHIAIRVREIGEGRGYRLFQIQKSGNRHLVDLRPIKKLPQSQRIGEILVMTPVALIASKVISYHQRRGKPKSGTDWRDIAMLLLQFPEYKTDSGPVTQCLLEAGADIAILDLWKEWVAQEIKSVEDEDDF